MKSNNVTSFIIVSGIIILVVFTIVTAYNLLPKNLTSNSYYVKVEDEMSAKIDALNIQGGKLIITTSGNALEYCVKSTKSTPQSSSLCWNKINNNSAYISIFQNKQYYVWLKDMNNNISSPMSIDTKKSENIVK